MRRDRKCSKHGHVLQGLSHFRAQQGFHRGRRKGGGHGPGLVSILARVVSAVTPRSPVVLAPEPPTPHCLRWVPGSALQAQLEGEEGRRAGM